MKIVINSDYGGFSLSDSAIEAYAERKGITLRKEERIDSVLSADYYLEDGNERLNQLITTRLKALLFGMKTMMLNG